MQHEGHVATGRDMTMGCVAMGGGVATERGNVVLQQLAGGGKCGQTRDVFIATACWGREVVATTCWGKGEHCNRQTCLLQQLAGGVKCCNERTRDVYMLQQSVGERVSIATDRRVYCNSLLQEQSVATGGRGMCCRRGTCCNDLLRKG